MEIAVESLEYSYEKTGRGEADRSALAGLDLTVGDGEMVTLLGPSGSGKTTLLSVVAGFLQPRFGIVRFGDRVVSSSTSCLPPQSRELGMVFQDLGLWPHMTVEAHLDFVLRCRGVSRRERAGRRAEMLEEVELKSLSRKRPAELSGGEAQRLALARALIARPEVLLLDEPLGALDLRLRGKLLELVAKLHERFRPTALHVTHDYREAASGSGRLAVLDGGAVAQIDRPETIYLRPASEVVARLTGEVNVLEANSSGERGVATPLGVYRSDFPTGGSRHFRLLLRPEQVLFEASDGGEGAAQITNRVFEQGRWKLRATAGELELMGTGDRELSVGDAVTVTLSEPVWGVAE